MTASRVVLMLLCGLVAFAQDGVRGERASSPQGTSRETISLFLHFPVGRLFSYVYHDTTDVHRVYSDSSTLDYRRTVTYYLSLEAVESPHNGVASVQVTIDSLAYSFSSGGNTISYKPGDQMPLQFPDFVAAVVPVNRQFRMEYSPYWDVATIEGDMLDWLRSYVTEGAEKVSSFDSVQQFVWLRNISLPVLAQYADPQKGALPAGRVALDSVWTKPFVCLADGIEFRDASAKTRIVEQRGPVFVLETRCDSLQPKLEALKLYNIGRFVDITGGSASCIHRVDVHKAGFIESASSILSALVTCRVRNEVFQQHIRSHTVWTLRGQYDY
ncbi:MAG: hypothetical protein KatS3mg039_1222 [Candidatus Kapaibacterium sp.]|nr:MAG: hypothetical protein KatS3mg039_1222 [Candidatus Kapabacteria bacterium]